MIRFKHKISYAIVLILIFSFVVLEAKESGIHAEVDKLILKQDFIAAEKKAKEYLKTHPNDVNGLCALACVYRNKSFKTVISMDKSAMGIKDDEGGWYEIQGKSDLKKIFKEKQYYNIEEYAKAEELYYKIIKIDPSYRNAYFNLLNSYVVMKEFNKYFKVVDMFINNLKDYKKTPRYLHDLALKLSKKEYYDYSIQLYSKILKYFPDHFEAESDMGTAYMKKGKIIKAKSIFKKVYKKEPKDIINLDNYYFTCLLTEEFETAFVLLKASIELDQDDISKLYELGLLSILLNKDYTPVFKKYLNKRAVEAKDINEDFWYQSALSLSKFSTYEKKDKVDFLLFLLNQLNKADYKYNSILVANILDTIEPTNFSLLVHASVFGSFMFFDKTIEYLNKINQRREIDTSIITEYNLNWNYGRTYYLAKKYEEAKKYFLKNHKINKKDAHINYYLGKCFLFLGEKEEAKKFFKINSEMNDKEQMEFINYSIRELKKL